MITDYHNKLGRCIGFMSDVGPIFNWCSEPLVEDSSVNIDLVEACGGEFAYNAQMQFYGVIE